VLDKLLEAIGPVAPAADHRDDADDEGAWSPL
jgi:GTP-binding protein